MNTVYDWVTIAVFSGLVVLLLQRSVQAEPSDKLWQYGPAAIGCALANWLGNQGQTVVAVLTLGAVVGYTAVVLKPFRR